MAGEFGAFNDLAKGDKLDLKGNPRQGPRQRNKPKATKKAKGQPRKSTPTQEQKYQAIKLYHSNVISLSDLKALFRVVAVVADDEYTSASQQKAVLATRDRMETIKRLTQTRSDRKLELELKAVKKSRLVSTRAEHIAEFTSGHKGRLPHNWKRYGSLVNRSGRVNEPMDGSSRRKIGKPRYKGFKEFNRDYDALARALVRLLEQDSRRRGKVRGVLKKVKEGVSISAKP
jgi:hypothetical protein